MRSPQKFAQSSLRFWHLLSKFQNHKDDCVHFCGLHRKAELYVIKKEGGVVVKKWWVLSTFSTESNHNPKSWLHNKWRQCKWGPCKWDICKFGICNTISKLFWPHCKLFIADVNIVLPNMPTVTLHRIEWFFWQGLLLFLNFLNFKHPVAYCVSIDIR